MISFIGDWFTIISLFLIAGEVGDAPRWRCRGAQSKPDYAPLQPLTGMLADSTQEGVDGIGKWRVICDFGDS